MITENVMNDVFYGFMLEDADEFHSFAKPALMNAAKDMITETVGLISDIVVPDISVPVDYLNRMKNNMNYGSLDGMKKKYSDFFNKLASNPKLAEASVYFPMVPDTVHKINAKYLVMFISEAKATTMNAIKSGKEKIATLETILDTEKIDKYKLQIADVTKNGISDTSAATELPEPLRIVVTKGSIKETIIPFIEDADTSAKTINNTISVVQNELRLANKALSEYIDAVNAYVTNDTIELSKRTKVKAYAFTVATVYRQLVSYLCSATILKMRYYMYNSMSLTNLYNGLTARNGEMFESVEIDKFDTFSDEDKIDSMSKQGFAITKDIRRTIFDMAVHDLGDVENADLTDVDFDNSTYSEAANVFKDIESQLRTFTKAIEEGQIFITARETADLQNGLDYTYASKITSIVDGAKQYYDQMKDQTKNAIRMSIAAEMDRSQDLLIAISSTIDHTMKYLAETKLGFEESRNQSYKAAVYEDCIEFFTTVREDIKYLVLKVANAFFDRYKYLLSMIYASSPYSSEIPTDVEVATESSYLDEGYQSIIKEHQMYNTAECKNVMFAYRGALSMMTESVYLEFEPATIFTEADEQNQAAQTVKNSINANKPTGPDKLVEWIKNFALNFVNKAKQITGMNDAWLEKNESTLRSLTSSQETEMYPFFSMNTNGILNSITDANRNIRSINVQQLYTKKPEDLFKEIYGGNLIPIDKVKLPDGTDRKNGAIVRQYFMIGTRPYKQVKYTPEQILRNIGPMIDFCKGYKSFATSIKTRLTNLADSLSDKSKEGESLARECGIDEIHDAYAFMMMEADANNNNANTNQNANNQSNTNNQKAPAPTSVKVGGNTEDSANNGGGGASSHSIKGHLKQLNDDYRAFSSGIMSAVEYRYFVYMNTLRGLIRANKGSASADNGDNNSNNNQNQSNNQNNNEGGNA